MSWKDIPYLSTQEETSLLNFNKNYSKPLILKNRITKKPKKYQSLKEKETYLLWQYGKDLDWYYQTIIAQNNKCPLCGRIFGNGGRRAVIDHNHKTGQVRGILCNSCNSGLGMFQDNAFIFRNAINYLAKWG